MMKIDGFNPGVLEEADAAKAAQFIADHEGHGSIRQETMLKERIAAEGYGELAISLLSLICDCRVQFGPVETIPY